MFKFKTMEMSHVFVALGIFCYVCIVSPLEPNKFVEEIVQPEPEVKPAQKRCTAMEKSPDDGSLRLAWLAPEREYHNLSAATSVGALQLALTFIRRQRIFRDYQIRAKWYDSDCDSKQALAAVVQAVEEFDPDVFIGPPCSVGLMGVAQLGSIWNRPVFSWVSDLLGSEDKDKYNTLVRLSGPLYAMAEILRQASIYFEWHEFAIIYDEQAPYEAVAVALKTSAETKNYNIKSFDTVNNDMKGLLQKIKKFVRIILFVVPWHTLRDYLLIAHDLGMANGEYAFVCLHGDLFTSETMTDKILSDWGWRRNDTNDDKAREIYESVIHIIKDPLSKNDSDDFQNFSRQAARVKLPNWELPNGDGAKSDAYGPYLYDAVLTWAFAVNLTLTNGGNPRDGARIYETVPKAAKPGATGDIVFNEPARDRMVNYQVLDMRKNGTFYKLFQFQFSQEGTMKFSHDDEIAFKNKGRWPTQDGRPPRDIPGCGFDGEKCVKVDNGNFNGTIIGASVSASVVLILAVAVHLMLRRYRRQLHLQGLLWQVKFEEIDFVTAWITGSIRNSFKVLSARKPSRKAQFKGRYNISELKSVNSIEKGKDGSPEIQAKSLDPGLMFGSVAYVRGNLTSVKRIQKINFSLTKDILLELNQLMEMKHQNMCAFVGACLEPSRAILLWEYCAKGSLQDVIWNQNIKLDQMFMFALSHDVAKGLEYIHKSSIHYHGNLKSTNCVVDSRWTCKLTDFGVLKIRSLEKLSALQANDETQLEKMLWTAPEVLREEKDKHGDKHIDHQKADIYALGIILKELFSRSGPYTEYPFLVPYEIIEKVKCPVKGSRVFRPMLSLQLRQHTDVTSLMDDCWHEDPSSRPSATRVLKALNRINPQNLSMIDNMIVMLEKYANHLEELVAERTSELDAEKEKAENLLYRMLPQTVAKRLKSGQPIEAEHFDDITLYFSDIVGFTAICASSTPIQVVNLLNSLYTLFDSNITKYDVYKVETIGDAYMLASGLPKRNGKKHIQEIADSALDILASVSTFCIPHQPDKKLRIRIGIHTGPVVAGVVGLAMPRYCLFGDTVNTASRMESTGLPLRIHLSSKSRNALEMYPGYHLLSRGEIPVKGKGLMRTYFLCGKEGFQKELPHPEENSDHTMRASVTSINSMASLVSYPSTTLSSTSSNTNLNVVEEMDVEFKSKVNTICEVTSL